MADNTSKPVHDEMVEVDENRDPISGEPGAHPVGVGLGAAAVGAAGTALGAAAGGALSGAAVAGPVGGAIGAVVGAVAGGYAGKGIAESVDPTVEESYWRETFPTRPYATGATYEDYAPAYRYGWESRTRHHGRHWNEVETDLQRGWDETRHEGHIGWEKAKHAARDAWDRIERTMPGDLDKDGR